MKERMLHPTTDNLEAYAEGLIDPADRAVIDSHLLGCPRCENLVEDCRSLFHSLRTLPRFVPSPGFADRVMARVRIAQPWHARAGVLITRFLPRTTRGWALAAAMLALPVLAGGILATWLLSKSYVTTHGLWVFATDRIASGIASLVLSALTFLMQTDVAAWLTRSFGTVLTTGGARGIGVLAGTSAILIIVSVWVLYTNLFRNPERESNYVTFSY
ncbi:MAG: anti-sigma factor family protein [Longimicrobiales bacterium]